MEIGEGGKSFSAAAFLKVLSLNDKPQSTNLKSRLLGGSGDPYDFHRSLKLATKSHALKGTSIAELVDKAPAIKQVAERKSYLAGLTKLAEWEGPLAPARFPIVGRRYRSPKGLFEISFQPEFGTTLEGRATALQIWNTKGVDLKDFAAYELLALMGEEYEEAPLDDFGILSLIEPKLLRLSDSGAAVHSAAKMVARIDNLIVKLTGELGLPPPLDPANLPSIGPG